MEDFIPPVNVPPPRFTCEVRRIAAGENHPQSIRTDILILEAPVSGMFVEADLVVSKVALHAESFVPASQIGHLLVPETSSIPQGLDVEVHWMPVARAASPVAANTYSGPTGMSIWHYLALGLFPSYLIEGFVASTHEVTSSELRRDIWEYSGAQPDLSVYRAESFGPSRSFMDLLVWLPPADLHPIVRYRTPLELCVLVGRPLLQGCAFGRTFEELPQPLQEIVVWSESLIKSRRFRGLNGLG